jgi:alpha-tubulin suppressor-like RCC1 family protein
LPACTQLLGDFTTGAVAGSSDGGVDGTAPQDAGGDSANVVESGGADTGVETGPRDSGVPETGPPMNVITDAVQVSAGEHHTCAIRSDTNVYCWGSNSNGQLGVSPTTMPSTERPVQVPMITGAKFVSAGYLHTCAIDGSGAIWCWGANDTAQLGLGMASSSPGVPTKGTTVQGAIQVSAGEHHTCAVDSGGDVYCWGGNDAGQISSNTMMAVYAMPTALQLPAGTSALSASAGSHHSCATLNAAPSVICWGTNSSGEIGVDPTTFPGVQAPTPPAMTMGVSFLLSAVGHDHSCGAATSGQVWCWGSNASGQSGAAQPMNVVPPTASSLTGGRAISVTAGDAFSCALDNGGGVSCWGADVFGQLGNGTSSMSPNTTPSRVTMLGGAAQVSAGYNHACAIVGPVPNGGSPMPGPLFCWGNNADGQLGDGTTAATRPSPVPVVLP